jgi:hypothetical protein
MHRIGSVGVAPTGQNKILLIMFLQRGSAYGTEEYGHIKRLPRSSRSPSALVFQLSFIDAEDRQYRGSPYGAKRNLIKLCFYKGVVPAAQRNICAINR